MDAADHVYAPGAVCFEGGRLTYVGPVDMCSASADALEVDTSGTIVIPGLVNAHCHSPMTFMRGLAENCTPAEWFQRTEVLRQAYSEDDVYWSTLHGCCEMLLNGITCVADRYSRMDTAARAVVASGIRASLGPSIFDGTYAGAGLQTLAEARRLIDRYGTSGEQRVSCGLAPIGPDTSSTELLQATRRAADETGARIYIHAAQSHEELQRVRVRGYSGAIRYLHDIGFLGTDVVAAHCIYVDRDEVALLASDGVHVAHCPVSNAKIEATIAPVSRFRSAGVNVAVGTDCAASNNTQDLLRELQAAALLQRVEARDPVGPSARALFSMAMRVAARGLGLEQWTGSLEVGKRADLTVLDAGELHLQPPHDVYTRLVYAASGRDARDVFVDGEQLVQDGRLTRHDRADLLERARRYRERTVTTLAE